MSIVALVSGGLDSTLVVRLAMEEGITVFPLFVDYGQRAKDKEYRACQLAMKSMGLPEPKIASMSGFGDLVHSGLTDCSLDIVEDAFTPGRNLLFLLLAASYAYQKGADAVSIGLLHESTTIFPDQTPEFLQRAEQLLSFSMGINLKVLAPLSDFTKQDVIALANIKGITNTYSCHLGEDKPCGHCIACKEFIIEE
ncbi:7-cyano-7-deazaguanine synthase [Vibrio fluvialis]|nr:7-cyano-7-deazaguanine synthase [Vibrio fluvialis]